MRQYAFGQHYGSVTETYSFEEEQELYGAKYHSRVTKSILYCMGIYEHQQKGVDYLIEHQDQYKDIYAFVGEETAKELYEKYPRMREIKDKWSWGSELRFYYMEGHDTENPRVREVDCDIIELDCSECHEEFEVNAHTEDIEDEIFQCPHCKKELKVTIEYEPVFSTTAV